MTDTRQPMGDGQQGLTEGLPAELRELDTRLTRAARLTPVPPDLADRVLASTIDLLPRRPSRLRLAGSLDGSRRLLAQLREQRRLVALGRLALAASLGLAFATAYWIGTAPSSIPTLDVEAAIQQGVWDQAMAEIPDYGVGEMASLLDTWDLTIDDLRGDLALTDWHLEM